MFSALRRRLASECGFTLPELLVVMVIIGLLAAIAYAIFLGQRTKAVDAKAKDQAAALTVDIESCFTDADDYSSCTTTDELGDNSLQIDASVAAIDNCTDDPSLSGDAYPDPANGQVAVVAASSDCFVLEAVSDDGHYFWVIKRGGGAAARSCAPPGQGSCIDTGDANVGAWSKG